jgi:hypothetical protein
MLLTLNAIVLVLAGWFALGAAQAPALVHVWLGAVAVAHLAVGLATASTQCNRDVRLLALALGVVLFDVTLATSSTGPSARSRGRSRPPASRSSPGAWWQTVIPHDPSTTRHCWPSASAGTCC